MCAQLIEEAVTKEEWTNLGKLSETVETQNRPAAVYKSWETETILHGRTYRTIVVHSSAHDKRRQKRIDRELEKEQADLLKQTQALAKQEFFCRADAEKAAEGLRDSKHTYYIPLANVVERPKYKRGRPKKDGTRILDRMMYVVKSEMEETEAATQLRKQTGCFVLICNLPPDGSDKYSAYDVLRAYKDQYGIEQNFGFLKNTPVVNCVFLKKLKG